jgi:hypothetical protein
MKIHVEHETCTNHIRGVLNAITAQNFSKILCAVNYRVRLAERKRVIGVGKLCLCGCQLVHLHQKWIFLQTIMYVRVRAHMQHISQVKATNQEVNVKLWL